MKKFIQLKNGKEVGHPISQENLQYIFNGEIPKDLELHGFREVKINENKEVSLEELKQEKKGHLKELFNASCKRPKVDTGLGYEVDGGVEDLINFEVVRDKKIKTIKLSNNTFVTLKDGDAQKIIDAIKEHGVKLYNEKWQWEEKIDATKNVEELNALKIDAAFGTETV